LHSSSDRTSIGLACLGSRGRLAVCWATAGGGLSRSTAVPVTGTLVSVAVVAAAAVAATSAVTVAAVVARVVVAVAAVVVVAVATLIAAVVAAIRVSSGVATVVVSSIVSVVAIVAGAAAAAAAAATATAATTTLLISPVVSSLIVAVIAPLVAAVSVVVITRIATASVAATAAVIEARTRVYHGSLISIGTASGKMERSRHTSLGRAKVLARCGSTRAGTTGLLNAHGAALNHLALETLLGGFGLLRSDHLDESKSTGLFGVRVAHDLALLNLAILFEHLGDLSLGQARVDSGDEEVGAGVDGTIIVVLGRSVLDVAAEPG
jgi:hypothetical protein